ncbi:hypothetical protein BH10BAC5_BH10BAC5_26240 [soil metagenome]
MRLRKTIVTLFVLALLAAVNSGNAFADGITKNVKFKKGMYSATYSNSVVRGDRDIYKLKAASGQTMEVKINSTEDNAVFQIINTKTGKMLSGAKDGDDATIWKGELPSSGTYKIIVGGTRGNATYDITIAIL